MRAPETFVTDATSCPNTPTTTDYLVKEISQSAMLTARSQTDNISIDFLTSYTDDDSVLAAVLAYLNSLGLISDTTTPV